MRGEYLFEKRGIPIEELEISCLHAEQYLLLEFKPDGEVAVRKGVSKI